MAVTRHTWSGGWWEVEQAEPHPALRGIVVGPYVAWRERAQAPTTRREFAATVVPLIVNFDAPYRLESGAHTPLHCTSFSAGVYDTWVDVHGATSAHAVQVNLTPLGAHAVLQQPLSTLTNLAAPVETLLGREGAQLVDGLGHARDFGARVRLLDAFLLRRVQSAPPVSRVVQWCWAQLAQAHGQVAIGALQRETGWSAARLGRAMREHCGVTPRRLGNLLRFEQVVRDARALLRAGQRVSWSRVAASRGYADQAHLSREFQRCAGMTPGQWAAQVTAETPAPLV